MAEASDTSERGLERLICAALAGHPCEPGQAGKVAEARPGYGGVGWSGGDARDYDREFCVDRVQLSAFVHATQPEVAESLALDEDGPTRRKFLARLQGEITKRGTIDVLRHGVKAKAKAFVRTYGFLSCVLPYTNAEWEKRSIFLNFLISKLPAPDDEDLSKGILDAIDMDSYRVEKRAVQQIMLPDQDAEIEPVPASGGGQRPEPELDRLSNILKTFNDLFGDIAWQDRDRVGELITKTIPAQVAADVAFQNARQNSDDANARIEHDRVLARSVTGMVKDDAELFKQLMDNEGFKRWMTDRVFELACEQPSVT